MEEWVSLDGLRTIVTAAGSGAGRVVATAFADLGARVVACDVAQEAIDALRAGRSDIHVVRADVGCERDIGELFQKAAEYLGGVDVLINNAGIAGPTAAAEDVSLADWHATFAVNLTGHFLCARQAIPFMKAQRSGAIINISSISGMLGLPFRIPYAVSKAGVVSLTQNLARELGPYNIRVNAVLPGVIEGERIRGVITAKAKLLNMAEAAYEAQLIQYSSMRTMVSAQDVAEMCLFLASDKARRVSGQMIAVDGDLRYEA
jgi:NAD(P)-dependent dehydrogenase (short-subunit alcohol dehydrogenase family)